MAESGPCNDDIHPPGAQEKCTSNLCAGSSNSSDISFVNICVDEFRLLCQDPPNSQRISFDTLTSHTIEGDGRMTRNTIHVQIPVEETPSRPLSPHLQTLGLSFSDDFLASYFDRVICSTGALIDDLYHNPMRRVVLPAASESELIQWSVLLAATHEMRQHGRQYRVQELQLQQKILEGLRNTLNNDDWVQDDALLGVLTVCTTSISNSPSAEWLIHLSYFRKLLMLQPSQQHTFKRSLAYQFFMSYFTSHTVLAKTLFSLEDAMAEASRPWDTALDGSSRTAEMTSPPSKDHWSDTTKMCRLMPSEDRDFIDPWNGCSNTFQLLLNDICSLKDEAKLLLQLSPTDYTERIATIDTTIRHLKARLLSLTQLRPSTLDYDDHPESASRKRLLKVRAEAYRTAALLFLHQSSKPAFYGRTVTSPLPGSFPALSQEEVTHYTKTTLDSVHEVVAGTTLPFSWGLWPLFIAACTLQSEDDKVRAISIFTTARQKKAYENIPRAQKVVELLWLHRDLSCIGNHRPRPHCYEWEIILDLLGWRPSFA
ncbi:hypothetical protein PV08_00472 [Exophiala spinifera]|uniref:Fungal-specific transcription factor domain-containing protein n=1 Tax=Exophiala spinifera TaxID=91928 RepID=A0A0D2A510_9EURO|nr:uncharacterized protein PV08_00472 [Exophiala spinifera]KIW19897.1 hypothetical protein PV08_00472 [Exophiala spinifera]